MTTNQTERCVVQNDAELECRKFGHEDSSEIIGGQREEQHPDTLSGLAELPSNALLGDVALARLLHVCTRTLRRMVKCGQLPEGVKLGGKRMWIAGKVIEYLTAEADRLATEARKRSLRVVQGRI